MTGGEVAGGAVAGGAVAAGAGITTCGVVAGEVGDVVESSARGAVVGLVDGVGAAAAVAGTTNQVPPTPCPAVSPAFLSPLKRYSGMPLNATCSDPSGRVMVPTADAVTPFPAVTCGDDTVKGGQVVMAQAPVQVLLPVPSGENR